MNRIKPLLFVATLIVAVVVTALVVGRNRPAAAAGAATPQSSAAVPPNRSAPEAPAPHLPAAAPRPLGTVKGSTPHTQLTLLRLRRTGPKVVSASFSLSLGRQADSTWLHDLEGPDGAWYSVEGIVLVDEVNGREHFVLKDADGTCLCSTGVRGLDPGETVAVSAKFPAPPAGVQHASLVVPGFPSFDRVPIEP
jgi:hypothetical protein